MFRVPRPAWLVPAFCLLVLPAGRAVHAPLEITTVVADADNFHVVSALIAGPTEVILVDAQNRMPDGRLVADRVAATGRRLKAIVITHPDHDHYTGLQAVLERFPGTPVYMTPAGIEEYRKAAPDLARMRQRAPAGVLPDSLSTVVPFPSRLTVDGEVIEVLPDLQGDVERPTSTVLWIPSRRTLITGDVVFNQVHMWLAASTPATRTAWRAALDRLAALRPDSVVPGHKPSESAPNSVDGLAFSRGYLEAFDAERMRAANADSLFAAMRQRYPDARLPGLLRYASRAAFRPAGS